MIAVREGREDPRPFPLLGTALLAILTVGCGGALANETAESSPSTGVVASALMKDASQWIEMRHVALRLKGEGALRVRRLRGEVIPTRAGEPAVLDDPRSFSIRVTSGSVALTGADLSVLLNDFVFAYPGAPLKRLQARMEGGQIVLKGVMHKVIDLRFEITATGTLEPDGRIRLHPTRTRIMGLNGQALMRALGLHLDDLLDLKRSRGASVKGNDVFLNPTTVLPPPGVVGRLASFRVVGDRIEQDFVRLPDDSIFRTYVRADSSNPNYIYFRGGRLRFGKLLMTDTDLQIVDGDATDPFDLNLVQYNRQLVAGTSRTLANLGLRVVMPDFGSIGAAAAPDKPQRPRSKAKTRPR